MEPELIADYPCLVGENPLWHPIERKLYWTDIRAGKLYRYDPATGHHEECYQGEMVGGFTIQADGTLLLFMAKGAISIWRDGQLTPVIAQISGELDSRFNDVIADPCGRVFCGTMPSPDHPGSLYRLDTDGTITKLLDDIKCSNGFGFTLDRKNLYYTDSYKHVIYRFDYDENSGHLSNQQVFIYAPDKKSVPDGMTVDAEGCIWSARWDGSCLIRYTSEGQEERRIHFPVKKVSSLIFGGPDYTDIYVTTAGGEMRATDGAHAGALYRLNLGIRGLPEFYSRCLL